MLESAFDSGTALNSREQLLELKAILFPEIEDMRQQSSTPGGLGAIAENGDGLAEASTSSVSAPTLERGATRLRARGMAGSAARGGGRSTISIILSTAPINAVTLPEAARLAAGDRADA